MDPRSAAQVTALALCFITIIAGPTSATTSLAPLTLDQLTDHSELVVQGTIQSMESTLEAQGIFTWIEVAVSDTWKGTALSSATLRLYGGLHDGIRTSVLGAACMSAGEEVVLFLRPNGPSTYDVASLAEGKFEVFQRGDGSKGVRRDLSGIAFMEDADIAVPESIDALKQAVVSFSR